MISVALRPEALPPPLAAAARPGCQETAGGTRPGDRGVRGRTPAGQAPPKTQLCEHWLGLQASKEPVYTLVSFRKTVTAAHGASSVWGSVRVEKALGKPLP